MSLVEAMTDADRILAARALIAEIAHTLDCAEVAMAQGHGALREASLLAAMGAADAVVGVLGGDGTNSLDTGREAVA